MPDSHKIEVIVEEIHDAISDESGHSFYGAHEKFGANMPLGIETHLSDGFLFAIYDSNEHLDMRFKSMDEAIEYVNDEYDMDF